MKRQQQYFEKLHEAGVKFEENLPAIEQVKEKINHLNDNFTNYENLPPYDCCGDIEKQKHPEHSKGCIHCGIFPGTAFEEMVQIAKKYLNEDIEIKYVKSLYTIKPILVASEIDDRSV